MYFETGQTCCGIYELTEIGARDLPEFKLGLKNKFFETCYSESEFKYLIQYTCLATQKEIIKELKAAGFALLLEFDRREGLKEDDDIPIQLWVFDTSPWYAEFVKEHGSFMERNW